MVDENEKSHKRGKTLRTEPMTVTGETIDTIVTTGGYTHPLFRPNSERRADEGTTPLPGQGVLLLMGGLLEQSGILDHGIALLELKSVRFFQMVREGAVIRVEVEELESSATSRGKVVQHYQWTVVDENNERIAQVQAVMLVHATGDEI